VLNVTFNYFTTVDSAGRTLFCFSTPNGLQGPTLHVLPGDTLNISVTNQVPAPPPGSPTEVVSNSTNKCGDSGAIIVGGIAYFQPATDLFAMVREGFSYMPAFRDVITDVQITATIAYIKATWPVGLRISQALLKPRPRRHAGNVTDSDWTLPPTCTISAQRWRTTSR
jgi:hypothetical protein